MNTVAKCFLLVIAFLSFENNCLGRNLIYDSAKRFNVSGNNVITFIPAAMNVEFTPARIETSNDISTFFYKFSVLGKDTIYSLHWYIYVCDSAGRLVNKNSWWDSGEWRPKSMVEESIVFGYNKDSGTTIAIVLRELVSGTGMISVNSHFFEQNIADFISGKRTVLPRAKFVSHISISTEDERNLVEQSMKVILGSQDLRHVLKLEGQNALLLANDHDDFSNIKNVRLISKEQINSKLMTGEVTDYFDYCCSEINGNSVKIILNYNMPTIHIRKGIRIILNFYKGRERFTLHDIYTEHF